MIDYRCRAPMLVIASLAVLVAPAGRPEASAGSLAPAHAARSFRLADDQLVIELVAAEPDVISPVAIAWDEDGRLFVAEMIDYPLGPMTGRVRLLEDPDDRGRDRKATVFADKLPFPNSVLPWNGGVLVTAAPNIWFLKDTRGTGRADRRRVVLTGFGEGNQQLRVNGLYRGLDNWIYGANGRNGGDVRKPDDPPQKAIALGRRDFRFRPETGQVEAIAGFSQFGLAHDDWGNRFPSWNTAPLRHVVLEDRYLSRNPLLAATAGVADIADPADPNRVFAISPPPTTFNREPVTFFNASCGNAVYRGDALGEDYRGNLFVCEPLTNLVQRRILNFQGVTFTARRGEPGKEFLASTDPWFHPVNLATGPDGALYVVDFYRRWVEHPGYVPESLRDKYDWREGSMHGRIWRIRPKQWTPRPSPRLSRATTAELARHLNDANGWWRDTAQRLLVERRDRRAVPLLQELVKKAPLPQARIHALWTLHGLDALDDELLRRALGDPQEAVRRHAVQLAEDRVAGSPVLKKAVLQLADDPSPIVGFQVTLTLGGLRDREAIEALARIAARDPGDEWLRLAVLSGLGETAWPFLQALLKQHPGWLAEPGAREGKLLAQVAALVGAGRREAELRDCLRLLTGAPSGEPLYGRLILLSGLAEGLARSGRPLRTGAAESSGVAAQSASGLDRLFRFAREVALSESAPEDGRGLAIGLLAGSEPARAGEVLLELLDARQPASIQSAAARGLAKAVDKDLVRRALDGWNRYSTGGRREILAALLGSPDLAGALIEALEREKIAPEELDLGTRQALLRIPKADIRRRAEKLLQGMPSTDRRSVVQKYQAALRLRGDPRRGADLFIKNCTTCHQLQGQGHRVGADLSGVIGRSPDILLTDILDPNKEVAPDYMNYILVTKRGQILTGMIAAETSTSVKLRRAEGIEEVVLRPEIQELRSTGQSLMPEGLEQVLSVQDVADLLGFLRQPVTLPVPKGQDHPP